MPPIAPAADDAELPPPAITTGNPLGAVGSPAGGASMPPAPGVPGMMLCVADASTTPPVAVGASGCAVDRAAANWGKKP
jgi:hypothetical protein